MVLEERAELLNSLAMSLEKSGITITHIDIGGTPEYFEEKYRNLPKPRERDGHTPDIEGIKGATTHIGVVKINIKDDESINAQFKAFTNREIGGKEIPFHIAVPKSLKKEVEKKLYKLNLYEKYKNHMIKVWA